MNCLLFEKFNSFFCWVVPVQGKHGTDSVRTETSSDDTSDEEGLNAVTLKNLKKSRFISFLEMLV